MTRRYRAARVVAAGFAAFAVGGYVGYNAGNAGNAGGSSGPPASVPVPCVTSHPAGWTIQTCTDRSVTP